MEPKVVLEYQCVPFAGAAVGLGQVTTAGSVM